MKHEEEEYMSTLGGPCRQVEVQCGEGCGCEGRCTNGQISSARVKVGPSHISGGYVYGYGLTLSFPRARQSTGSPPLLPPQRQAPLGRGRDLCGWPGEGQLLY